MIFQGHVDVPAHRSAQCGKILWKSSPASLPMCQTSHGKLGPRERLLIGHTSACRRSPLRPLDMTHPTKGRDAPCAGTGRSRDRPFGNRRRSASGRRGAVADDARSREVRLCQTRPSMLPSTICTVSAPRIGNFRGSMAGLRAPLSTLRRGPHGQPRMTRGRCGSLLLHRKGLAPSTPYRSSGASHMFSGMPQLAAGSEPAGTYIQHQYRKMTNSSILTISALFTLAYLSTLPPSCGFGDVILLPFAVWIIWLKRLFSSTVSRARGQSY
jgi:hypothetical protein